MKEIQKETMVLEEPNKNLSLIFLVDDNPVYLNILRADLEKISDLAVMTFQSGEECLKFMHLNPKIVVLDYDLKDQDYGEMMNGVEVLKVIKDEHPHTEVIMLSGIDKINVATSSIKYGAYDYVVKNENAFFNLKNRIFRLFEKQYILSELKKNKTVAWAIAATVLFIVAIPVLLFTLMF